MDPVERLLELISKEYPFLVTELSGPWPRGARRHTEQAVSEYVWIANFKDTNHFLNQVHPGSSGPTPSEALFEGLVWLRNNINRNG